MSDYDGLYHRLFSHPRMVAHDAESVVMQSHNAEECDVTCISMMWDSTLSRLK